MHGRGRSSSSHGEVSPKDQGVLSLPYDYEGKEVGRNVLGIGPTLHTYISPMGLSNRMSCAALLSYRFDYEAQGRGESKGYPSLYLFTLG